MNAKPNKIMLKVSVNSYKCEATDMYSTKYILFFSYSIDYVL